MSSFDIEKFAKEVEERHPELRAGSNGQDAQQAWTTDDFERNLIIECPELVEQICEFDEKTIADQQGNTVSKKQQARDRHERLQSLMTDGRSLYEKQKTFHESMQEMDGPMTMLANAVKSRKRMEIRTRGAVRIDRVFEGIVTAFDRHFNLVMDDVTETVLRKAIKKWEIETCSKICFPIFCDGKKAEIGQCQSEKIGSSSIELNDRVL